MSEEIVQILAEENQAKLKAKAKGQKEKGPLSDEFKAQLNEFLSDISMAKLNGEEWVETTPEVIASFNRQGLKGAKFFIYQGIKVCEHGKTQEIIAQMDKPLTTMLFGPEEPINSVDKR